MTVGLAGIWLLVSGISAVGIVRDHLTKDIGGYAAAAWRQSPTIAYMQRGATPAVLYSNDPFAIRYHTGRDARLSPRRHAYQSPGSAVPDVPKLLESLVSSPEAYLVWFHNSRRDFLLSPDELGAWVTLEPVVSLGDGTVYRIAERLRR
jgi:hypothetical protein